MSSEDTPPVQDSVLDTKEESDASPAPSSEPDAEEDQGEEEEEEEEEAPKKKSKKKKSRKAAKSKKKSSKKGKKRAKAEEVEEEQKEEEEARPIGRHNGRYAHRVHADGTVSVRHWKEPKTWTDETIGTRISAGVIRRMGYRAGAKRQKGEISETVRQHIVDLTRDVTKRASAVAYGGRRMTITPKDVKYAIHANTGKSLY